MSYIGAQPTTASFPFDQFSGNGSTTAFTLTYAPASTSSIIVAVSGVVQNPNTYSCIGTTLTFSGAPPSGTNNISVLYLGLPVIGVSSPGNTAYFSSTSFTATASQTTFTPSGSYTPGFINVIRNGSQLAPADYTATNGTTVVLNNACVAGDVVVIEVYTLTSISNALPLTGGTVTGASTFNSTLTVNGAAVSGFTGFKNRIINPGMVIDQRNNGATINNAPDGTWVVDRWIRYQNVGASNVGRNLNGVTPPAGFTNYLGIQISTAGTATSGQYTNFQHYVEGFNSADLAWGTANAQAATISFWVRSSLTGTQGFALQNASSALGYPFTITINAANTWEYKTVTIPGPTTGTWDTTNGRGIALIVDLGMGSSFRFAAGSWQSGNVQGVTGANSLNQTLNATFYITGVQLERGSNATSFEFRDYGRELAMCQRYCALIVDPTCRGVGNGGTGGGASRLSLMFPVTMRAYPTLTASGTFNFWNGTTTRTGTVVAGVFGSTSLNMLDFDMNISGTFPVGDAVCMYAIGSSPPSILLAAEL